MRSCGIDSGILFFGVALIAVGLNVAVSGLMKIAGMLLAGLNRRREMKFWEEQKWRFPGELYFDWARAAECAMMPSVAVLSEVFQLSMS
eukprot:symbB.v1.2.010966.t1/scaffold727.1/size198231/11